MALCENLSGEIARPIYYEWESKNNSKEGKSYDGQ
jgi:hypothetical protein